MAGLTCADCGETNRPGAKFCAACGSALVARCPACGSLQSGGRFCDECGAPLSAAPAGRPELGEPSRPVAERRLVSLLFADLVGFTPLSEARDPETVRELLSAYFDRVRTVISRYGGTVEKFIGDAAMAVWGVPAVHEDDAERAVRAALDLVGVVGALGEELDVAGLALRVGVTTGHVAVTLGATGEGMVAGDAVNTAARVQTAAGPGQVWVDDATRALTASSIAYEPVGGVALKGKAEPVALFHAVRTTAVVGGDQRVDGLEAPFVGRDRELQVVKELFHAAAEDGRSRLVLVAGDPGIGKSRLAWEFEKYADAITSIATFWLRGRCLAYGDGVAGRALADMVRSLLRVTDADDDATVIAALDDRLERHVTDPAERAALRPRLASLLGLSDATFDRDDLFGHWRRFLEALTEDGSSVTLLVEDLQWADDGLLDFVEHVLETSRAPIMVLALARPEVTDRRPGIGAGRRSTTVFLEPLPDAAMGRLLDGLVADLPPVLRDELVRRAEGVPLYAVETVRTLIDRDVVVPSGGRYHVDPAAASALDLDTLGPPTSLHALLAARLDALSPDERRVVQDASVLGLTFTRAAIASLSPPELDLDRALDVLRHREILVVDNDPRSPERGQLRFAQALLRTVAYETLSRRDRQARHLAVAAHLERQPDADSVSEVIACHYLDACAAGAPDAARLQSRAAALLEQAAGRAVALGAPRDALATYRRLLGLPLPDPDLLRVVLASIEVAMFAGDSAESLAWLQRAAPVAEALGDEEAQLAISWARGSWTGRLGDVASAVPALQHVVDSCLGHPGRVKLLMRAAYTLVTGCQTTGDVDLAARTVLRLLPVVESYGDDEDFTILLTALSSWSVLSGYRRFGRLLRQATVPGEPTTPADVRNLGNAAAALMHDDPAEAGRLADRALAFARRTGLSLQVMPAAHALAARWTTGRWDEAVAVLDAQRAEGQGELLDWEVYLTALSALLAVGRGDPGLLADELPGMADAEDPVVKAWALMRRAAAEHLAGDGSAAATAVEAVHRLGVGGPANEDVPFVLELAVELLDRAGDVDRLDRLIVEMEELPLGKRYRLQQGHVLRARALVHAGRGNVDAAVAGLRDAAATYDALQAPYWAARTRLDLAAVLAGSQPAEAAVLLATAETRLREVNAIPALAQVERVRARLAVPVATGS